jgi:hypothetical protein
VVEGDVRKSATRPLPVLPPLTESCAVRLIKRGKQFGQGNAQAPSHPIDHVQRRGLLAPLQIAQVTPVHSRPARELLLRELEALPQIFKSRSEGWP